MKKKTLGLLFETDLTQLTRNTLSPVRQIRSDQGTNFISARNELQEALSELDHGKIRQDLLKRNCDWVDYKMNVPHASHMGGAWERQIRSVRNILAALLSHHESQLDDESLSTFMVENCRPLAVNDVSSPECRMSRSIDIQSAADHEIFCCPTSSWTSALRRHGAVYST